MNSSGGVPSGAIRRSYFRWGVLGASLLLGLTYFFPLWEIQLEAPQYPEGLGMQIWINKIQGDLQSINLLNHYIGMAKIVPESFAELKYFPIGVAVLIGLGLLCAAWGKRVVLWAWTSLFLVSLGVSFVDFYQWEYRFGHELNPDAAMKFDGMAYQPPLIGVKTLLNISAWSLPGVAGYVLFLAVLVACGTGVFEYMKERKGTLK